MTNVFKKNIRALRMRYQDIALTLERTHSNGIYAGTLTAHTGENIPFFRNNRTLHSRYNPWIEAERTLPAQPCFILFCGIGAGIHISVFLEKFRHACCAVCEFDYASFRALLEQVDLTHIIVQERVHFLHPLTHGSASQEIAQCYMPIIHGNFFVHYLQPWKAFFPTSEQKIAELTSQAMKIIRADFSVQVHFGKLWMRNALLNLRYAQIFTPKLPNINTQTEAIILGAGPSLEKGIEKIRSHRDVYTIFACDTAFPVCCTGGLMPDFFISIDPQYISYAHTMCSFPSQVTAIFDICACPCAVRSFYLNGNSLIFTGGGHPFSVYASRFSSLPFLETSSGTVAGAAYSVASFLGFTRITSVGTDFSYTNGKPYARGTYLSKQFEQKILRISPLETQFCNLMFRTPTRQ
ncbi:DUF115 domain-containing protein, partial [Treponema pallidum]